MPDGSEGAIRPQTVEFARETTTGVFPSSPQLFPYSENITSFSWSPSAGIAARRGLGDPDVSNHFSGPEEHEITVVYDLQAFPVTASGDPAGPDGDALLRTSDNALLNTHAIRVREDNASIPPSQAVNTAGVSKDTRLYLVGVGGYPSGVTYSGDPGSDQTVTAELSYQFEKVRLYQVDQPDSEGNLDIENLGSSTVDVIVEGDSTSAETVTVQANSTSTTTGSFGSIRGVRIVGNEGSADVDGDIVVSESSSGDALAIIRGSDWYGHGEGDLGVPPLDGGTQGAIPASGYETILDDKVERPGTSALAYEINSVEFSVENDIAAREQVARPVMSMDAGNRNVSVSATIVGATESVESAEQHLGSREQNVLWYLDGGLLQADNAPLTDFSGVDKSAGEAAMSLDNTFTGKGLTVTAGASP